MRLSIKIAVWILVIVLISGTLSVLTIVYFQHQSSTRDFKEFGVVLANTVYDDLRSDMIDHKPDQIRPMLSSLKKNTMINEVGVYSWNGKTAFSPEQDETEDRTNDPIIRKILSTGKQMQRTEKKNGRDEFCVLIPIKNEKACSGCHASEPSTLGIIEIGIRMDMLTRHLERDAKLSTLLFSITCSFILISVLLFLHRVVIKRLSLISNTIERFAGGEYAERIKTRSDDELGTLAKAFNLMADKVRDTIKKLEEAHEEFDRSLIRFGRLLASTLDIKKIPDLIVNELAASTKYREASILLRGEDDKLVLMGAKGIPPAAIEQYNSQPDVWEQGSLRFTTLWSSKCLFVSESLSINRLPGKQLFSKISDLHNEQDFYVFPLLGAEDMVGLLTMVIPSDATLEEDKLKMIRLICQETATAIENFTSHEMLKKVSITDELTQLYNQRHFFNTLKEEVARSERYGADFSLLFLDLDKFKLFNDSYGHRVGDKILHQVGQLIKGLTRSSDKVFRYGGDEFALILPQTGEQDANNLANRIRAEIESTNFVPAGQEVDFKLSASVGVVVHDGKKFEGEDDIFKAVDDAMHEAKKTGRNKVVVG
jgi:diguanylate cyclase (GGDEF)-like protein